MPNLKNCVAVVTGAGSGIGRALTLQLAEQGARLAISDVNPQGLEDTAALARELHADVHTHTLDVANREAVFAYADEIFQHFGSVNLVINNAGVGLSSGLFRDTTIDDFEWLMRINFSGVLYGTKAFLPMLEQAEWGHIVNLSSLFGLIGVAEQTAYNSSKFAVRGLTESLCNELEASGGNVRATSVHPGGIKTNIARNSRLGEALSAQQQEDAKARKDDFDKVARTTAESAAEQILQAVVRRQRRLLIGADAKFLDRVQRLFPTKYHHIFNWVLEKVGGKN